MCARAELWDIRRTTRRERTVSSDRRLPNVDLRPYKGTIHGGIEKRLAKPLAPR